MGVKYIVGFYELTQFISPKQVGDVEAPTPNFSKPPQKAKEAIDEKLWEEKRKEDPALLPHPPKKPVSVEKKIDTERVVKKETKMPAWKRAQLKKKGKKK